MKAQSKVLEDSALGVVGALRASETVFLGIVNNEARELNDYRIDQFGLRNYFKVFLSSCYVGLRKPGTEIFQLALDVLQRDADSVALRG